MYVANFTKESVHDYASFFNQPIESKEIVALRKEIQRLQAQLEESVSALEMMKGSTATEMYTPSKAQMVLQYQGRNQNFEFDLNTGLLYNGDLSEAKIINVSKKQGNINIFMGYSYPLASAIVRSFKYSIASDNSKVNIILKEEVIIPLLEDAEIIHHYSNKENNKFHSHSYIMDSIDKVNASEFIQTFYEIDIEVPFSLSTMRRYALSNAGFEVILRTARPKDLIILASISCEKSVPIHKMLKVTKEEYNAIIEKDCLEEFIWVKETLPTDKKYFANTMEIIDYLDNCKNWEEDLEFYSINHHDLYKNLLQNYLGLSWRGWKNFSEYYSFGKFCNYVITETINQGFTNIDNFCSTLRDYIQMCVDIGFTPHFYTTSLALTHNVASRNHKIVVTEEQEQLFKSRYEEFESFEFEEYVIIAPSKSEDIKNEGSTLNHCVASYIKDVLDGKTCIYFLRLKKKYTESLVTVEVKNEAVVQARGIHNRDLSIKEEEALRAFCADRKLAYKV